MRESWWRLGVGILTVSREDSLPPSDTGTPRAFTKTDDLVTDTPGWKLIFSLGRWNLRTSEWCPLVPGPVPWSLLSRRLSAMMKPRISPRGLEYHIQHQPWRSGKWPVIPASLNNFVLARQCIESRDITFNKGPYSQSYGFFSSHVQMWEVDIKKVEHRRIGAFELWCSRRLLRVPWTARRSNQSILKEINPEYLLKGLLLKLKLQYFGHPMWQSWLIGKDCDAEKDWRQEEIRATEDEMFVWCHWFNGHEFEQTLEDSEGQGRRMLQSMEYNWATTCHPWRDQISWQSTYIFASATS